MPLYLLSLPRAGLFSVCELTDQEAAEIQTRLRAAGAFDGPEDVAAAFAPVRIDDRTAVEALIDLWEAMTE
jgi:hypothetical protein